MVDEKKKSTIKAVKKSSKLFAGSSRSLSHLPAFRRKARKHYVRYFYLLVLLFLNISFLMSMIERAQHRLYVDFGSEAFLLVFILGLDCVMLPSLLFEVNAVLVREDALIIETMFGSRTVFYGDIVSMTMPKYLVWAVLRTKRGFYLINRREIPDFDQLLALLAPKLPPGNA